MDSGALKVETEKFVRTALAKSSERMPSETKIRKAVGEIVRAIKPVVTRRDKTK
jgi:hypothetical protein